MILDWYFERFYRTSELLKELGINELTQEISVPYGINALDPVERIQSGLKNKHSFLSAIKLGALYKDQFIPVLESCPLYSETLEILAKSPTNLSAFESLNGWEKLEFIELLFGLTTSHTTIKFQPIDFLKPSL
ncbi:MAG: hypothetical protein IPM57_12300 [Oligoflexia bacterium]|nr:hypothetical protein [Oligoflexia bacterium]